MRIAVLLLALALQAKEPQDWKPGRVVKLTSNPPLSSVDPVRSLKRIKIFTYKIDGVDATYAAQEKAKSPSVTLDSPVQYAVSEKVLYLEDADGKVHKLIYVSATPK